MKATRTYTMAARADSAAATRERIVRAAAAMFLEEPHEDVTLARIAKAASVSHQTVLNHFQSKDGVIRAVAELLGERDHRASATTPSRATCAGAVHALVDDYERMGDANFRWAASADRIEHARRGARRRPGRPPGVARRHVRRPPAQGRRRPGGGRSTPSTPPPTSTRGSCCAATWA